MQQLTTRLLLTLPLLFLLSQGVSHGQPTVRTKLAVECSDPAIRLNVTNDAMAKVNASGTHMLVDSGQAALFIRLAVTVVRGAEGTPTAGKPVAVALAVLVTRSPAQDHEIALLKASFVPITDLETAVNQEIEDALQ